MYEQRLGVRVRVRVHCTPDAVPNVKKAFDVFKAVLVSEEKSDMTAVAPDAVSDFTHETNNREELGCTE
jgi:hypothetical protein